MVRRRILGLCCAGVLLLSLVQEAAFTSSRKSCAPTLRRTEAVVCDRVARHAEAFDPFGWKGALKDTVEGLMDSLGTDEEPSKEEEQMVVEIFEKFDVDKDGILNLKEFNELQVSTEGGEAMYNTDQLKQLLIAVNPDVEAPERGMPFADYRRLYLEGGLRRAYSTDLRKDYKKIFGEDHKPAVEAVEATEAEPDVQDVEVTEPKAVAASAVPTDPTVVRRFPAGSKVVIKGLTGAVELNGQEGEVVPPSPAEAELAAEGRVIVRLSDGDRVALRADNVRLALLSS